MPISAFARNQVMDELFSGSTQVSLHTEDPGLNGLVGEISGLGYSRQELASYTTTSEGEKKSAAELVFTELPRADITHVGVWKGDKCIWVAELLAKRVIFEGDSLRLKAGNIVLELT